MGPAVMTAVDAAGGHDHYYGAVKITGPNATVTNNYLEGNFNGVVAIGYGLDSASGLYGLLRPVDTTVTENTIVESGNTGLVTDVAADVFRTATFDRNDYRYSNTGGTHWVWSTGAEKPWQIWQGDFRNDLNGTLSQP